MVVGGAVGCLLVLLGVVWWLLSHHSRPFLTQHLSALLEAEVRVARSTVSFRHGLGIGLEQLVVQNRSEDVPFLTAERVDVLLDLRALLRGQLLFQHISCLRPHIRLAAGEEPVALPPLVGRVLQEQTHDGQAGDGWLSPRLAVRHLVLRNSQVRYGGQAHDAALVMVGTDLDLSYSDGEGLSARLQLGLGAGGGMGQVSLQAWLPGWGPDAVLDRLEWNGTVRLRNLSVDQAGRWLGRRWPQARLDFNGRWGARGTRRIELTGEADFSEMPLGVGRLRHGKTVLNKLVWQAPDRINVQAELVDGRAEVGPHLLPVVIHTGSLHLDQGQLALSGLRASSGRSSVSVRGRIAHVLSAHPRADLRLDAEVDLADGLTPLLAVAAGVEPAQVSQQVQHARGQARVQLRLQGRPVGLSYDGQVRLRQAAFYLPGWRADISGLAGTLHVGPTRVTTDQLAFQIGQSSFNVRGWVTDYLSPRRTAELHVAVLKARDRDVAALLPLPPGTLLAADGTLSGYIEASLTADSRAPYTAGELRLTRIVLDLVSFLQPLEVGQGWLAWHGQAGTFRVGQGSLAGSALTGQGRFESLYPPHVEVSADLTALDLEAALAPDRPRQGAGTPGAVVRVDLRTDRLRYKSLRAQNLRLTCHWHDGQADLRLAGAQIAGGRVDGRAVLWSDRRAVLLTPQLTQVDASRFLQALGRPTSMLSGTLSGNGRIHIPDWQRWERLVDWDANLSLVLRDGVVQRLPVLVRLWSALSLQGLLSFELPSLGTGLAFSSLSGDLIIDTGRVRTDNLVLNSSAVRFDTSGSLDLAPPTLDLTTALVPLHGITSSVAKVPLAGKLLARGADRLTTLSFRVTGPPADPSVALRLVR